MLCYVSRGIRQQEVGLKIDADMCCVSQRLRVTGGSENLLSS